MCVKGIYWHALYVALLVARQCLPHTGEAESPVVGLFTGLVPQQLQLGSEGLEEPWRVAACLQCALET